MATRTPAAGRKGGGGRKGLLSGGARGAYWARSPSSRGGRGVEGKILGRGVVAVGRGVVSVPSLKA